MPPGVQNGAVNARGVVRLRCLPMHFPRGVIRTAEVKECGRRSLRPVTFLVPLELDCHHEDDEIRQRLHDDYDRNDNDDNLSRSVASISEAGGQGSPTTTADAEEQSIPHDASHSESTFHRTPGSSRESSPATGTNTRCNITTESDAGTPSTLSLPPSPTSSVDQQPSTSEGRDAGGGASDPIKAATTSCTATAGSHEELTLRGSSLDLPASRVCT